ncbi:DUF4097 family beta strand repeat-containing protein [Carnobacterium gallinarum]|uniref:DUF4097 family beta strand repeat-containing protein n=1 Tax=Carnobacterium gallinarum TaxID=2749 RepID=UPI0006905238|nr:DUF4097 family beta strand repeat-containing protein [Carnobacterium gallinarum]
MKTKKLKIVVLIGICMLVIGGIGAAITYPQVIATTNLNISKTIKADSIKKVHINGKSTEVNLEQSSDDKIHVKINGTSMAADKFAIQTKQTGNQLNITLKTKKPGYNNFVFFINEERQTVTLSLPKSVDSANIQTTWGQVNSYGFTGKDLAIETKSGEINLMNLTLDTLTTTVNSGEITLEKSEIKETKMSADAGEINIGELIGENANLTTITGEINLLKIATTNLNATTSAGSIKLKNKTIDQNIDLQTKFGDVLLLTENKPSNAIISAKTSLGDSSIFNNQEKNTETFGKGKNSINVSATGGKATVTTGTFADEDYNDFYDFNESE